MRATLRHADGFWPNLAALSYGVGGWVLGIALGTSPQVLLNAAGILLLSHSLMICAYLLHECVHNNVFKSPRDNARLGAVLAWLTGACYSPYEALRQKHFRHHVDNADVLGLDHRKLLARRPALRRLVSACEWAYLPAVDVLLHALTIAMPWRRRSGGARRRVLALVFIRAGLFALLALYSLKALLLYGIAYLLFLHGMRFFDVHQHTYEVFETNDLSGGALDQRGNRDYEQAHTYSNLISARFLFVNLAVLNFPYHNAHHARPTEPWYRLAQLHRELFGRQAAQVLPFANLLRSYHRYRVARILGQERDELGQGPSRGRAFVGALGVSFLVAH